MIRIAFISSLPVQSFKSTFISILDSGIWGELNCTNPEEYYFYFWLACLKSFLKSKSGLLPNFKTFEVLKKWFNYSELCFPLLLWEILMHNSQEFSIIVKGIAKQTYFVGG